VLAAHAGLSLRYDKTSVHVGRLAGKPKRHPAAVGKARDEDPLGVERIALPKRCNQRSQKPDIIHTAPVRSVWRLLGFMYGVPVGTDAVWVDDQSGGLIG